MCKRCGGRHNDTAANLCQVVRVQFHWQEWKNFSFMLFEKKILFCIFNRKVRLSQRLVSDPHFTSTMKLRVFLETCWHNPPYSLLPIFSEEIIRTSSLSTAVSSQKGPLVWFSPPSTFFAIFLRWTEWNDYEGRLIAQLLEGRREKGLERSIKRNEERCN